MAVSTVSSNYYNTTHCACAYQLAKDDQPFYQEQTINKIGRGCAAKTCVGVVLVTSCFQAAPTGGGDGENAMDSADLFTYTHIFYLNTPIDGVLRYQREGAERGREWITHDVLR